MGGVEGVRAVVGIAGIRNAGEALGERGAAATISSNGFVLDEAAAPIGGVGGGLAAFFVVVDGMEGSMLVLGIAGITKAPGDGTDGSDGTDGADGTDGTDGTDSTDGSDGSDTLGSGSFFGIL